MCDNVSPALTTYSSHSPSAGATSAAVSAAAPAGFGSDTLLTTVLSLVKGKIPEGLIEKRPDSHLLLHLGEIEQMKAVFEKVDVNDIHVLTEGLEVEGLLR